MLSLLSGNRTAWLLYMSIDNLSKEKQQAVKSNCLILLGMFPKILINFVLEMIRKSSNDAIRHVLCTLENSGKKGWTLVVQIVMLR